MIIPFWKMHGAGNDFILIDDRSRSFPSHDINWLSAIATRNRGIGCEGIILIQPSNSADFRMRFFNPDGNEVEMCGNGARCVAKLAHDIGAAREQMTIETLAGMLSATVRENGIMLGMTLPKDWRINRQLEIENTVFSYHFVNSGVPHAVIEMDDLDNCDVAGLGAAFRYHVDFAPAGTNANFIKVTSPDSIRVRTYERGVEAETPACGTGIVASALIAAKLGRIKPPVTVIPTGGDILTVNFTITSQGAENVSLLGPAVLVFTGSLEYNAA